MTRATTYLVYWTLSLYAYLPGSSQEVKPVLTQQPPNFSLVLGGPSFQLCRRLHLSGDALELFPRRMLVFALFTWLPLLLLSILDGHALGGTLNVPFLYDIEAHVRFLVALRRSWRPR